MSRATCHRKGTLTLTSRCQYCGRELPTKNFALFGHKPMIITLPCDCEESKEAARKVEIERDRAEMAEVLRGVWQRSGVPRRFLHVTADFDAAAPLLAGRWLYLCGENGRGKTHMACQAAKAYLIKNTRRDEIKTSRGYAKGSMRCRVSFHFTEAQSMLSEVSSSWSRWDMSEEAVKSRWAGVDLLVLDDLGKGVPSEWAAETLFDLINRRWADNNDVDQKTGETRHRLTILTSQYKIDELEDRYRKAGSETLGAMMSRLRGECDVRIVGGNDRRVF